MKNRLPHICFFGCGAIAARHAKLLKKLYPEIEISFASRSLSKAKGYASNYRGSLSFGSYEDAAESNLFDIAFITTPPSSHSDLALLNAKNKKDIIIEKPVARNLIELSAIEKAVSVNKIRFTVAENYLYKPFLKRIKSYIERGYIGSPLFVELNKTNRDSISGWRSDAEVMGGGALFEGGIHWVNALVSLAGSRPVRALALKPDVKYLTNIPFEDSIMLCVEFENGVAGKMLHSWRIPNPLKGIGLSKIYGAEGVITFESNGLFMSVYGKKNRISFTNPFDFLGFKAMHRAFIEDYISDREWQPTMERIKVELGLIESAYRSLTTRKFENI